MNAPNLFQKLFGDHRAKTESRNAESRKLAVGIDGRPRAKPPAPSPRDLPVDAAKPNRFRPADVSD